MTVSMSQYSLLQQMTSARVVSTANLAGTYFNGTINNGVGATLTASSVALLTIDSVVLNNGDRVLLVGQTASAQNGIYVVTSAGSASSIWILTRSDDFHNIEQLKVGQYISVGAGTQGAGSMFVLVEPFPGAMGFDGIVFNPTSDPASGAFLVASNNLSDVASAVTARTNISAQSSLVIKAATTGNIGAGGAGPTTIPLIGLTSASVVVATIEGSSNSVSVVKSAAATDEFNVTFSGDPGATCTLNYIAFLNPQ